MGCSRSVPGLFRAVPGCSGGVPGVFRGVPGCSGSVPGFTDTQKKKKCTCHDWPLKNPDNSNRYVKHV